LFGFYGSGPPDRRAPRPQPTVIAPQTVLIVRFSHLGDVVQTLPLFHALRTAWPRARIGFGVQSEFAALLAPIPGLDAVIEFDRRGGALAWWRFARAVRGFAGPAGLDLAVDAQGNWKSAAALLVCGAPRRVGYAPCDWRERPAAIAATEWAPPAAPASHALERVLGLAHHVLGEHVLGQLPRTPRLDPALNAMELEAGRARADQLLGAAGGIVLHVGTRGDIRSWPSERVESFARAAADAGLRIALVSGPREAEEGARLRERLSAVVSGQGRDRPAPVAHWIGQRGLRELAAFLAAAAERRAVFVGADSGPIHLAAAVGLRSVLLAGPQDPTRTGPWPLATHRVATAQPGPGCRPCRARRCTHPQGPVCMAELDEARVLDLALALALH